MCLCTCVSKWRRSCQKKSYVHVREIKCFTHKQNKMPQQTQSLRKARLPQSEKAGGICACLAGTWMFLHTLLHSSCILESGEHRAACFSFGERGSRERGWGWVRFTHRPTLQIGPDWASSDPEKQPKQEERCEFMTKQNTGSQRATLLGGFS